MQSLPRSTLEVRVVGVRQETPAIRSLELVAAAGGRLPAFEAGAHVDVTLPNGLIRSYSLVGSLYDRSIYRIAVARDPHSRGGSVSLHEDVKVGSLLSISAPKNHFPLAQEAGLTVLVAGGIGITPLWCMVQQLQRDGRPWRLHYACRSRSAAAFLTELEQAAASGKGTLDLWFDDEHDQRPLDLKAALADVPDDAHLYCCGPAPMMAAYREATALRSPERVHFEYFKADEAPGSRPPLRSFTVVLARSGHSVQVPEGSSILDALMINGIDAPYSCYEGLCGTCETRVLEGVPDHRDQLLTERARASNETVIICCSGSRTPTLVLDL